MFMRAIKGSCEGVHKDSIRLSEWVGIAEFYVRLRGRS